MIKSILVLVLGTLFLASWPMTSGPRFAQPVAPEPTAAITPVTGFKMLARGPIHEAFASSLIGQPRPPPIATREPPATMEEWPPDQQVQGNNVQWIPGYWEWDVDCNNFLWVSGLWRDLPAGHQWVPGHWNRLTDGWQRVPGYWTQYAKFQFLPPPPFESPWTNFDRRTLWSTPTIKS
jgi:hypothetical protein